MKYDIKLSDNYEALIKDAEERIEKEVYGLEKKEYRAEIVLVPTGVIYNKKGYKAVTLCPDNKLI